MLFFAILNVGQFVFDGFEQWIGMFHGRNENVFAQILDPFDGTDHTSGAGAKQFQ